MGFFMVPSLCIEVVIPAVVVRSISIVVPGLLFSIAFPVRLIANFPFCWL